MADKERRRTTLKDIAAQTGFSVNTVSVALRGGPKVPTPTRQKIEEVARQLDYTPNALARSLARKSSGTVGVVVNNLQNPILTLAAEHIQQQLEAHGFQALLRSTGGDQEREKRAIDSLRELQVEGILIYPSNHLDISHLVALRATGMPIVLLAGSPDRSIDMVAVDDFATTEAITRHLIETGHRRIGLLDVCHVHGNFSKLQGFLAAHDAAAIEVDRKLVYCPADRSLPETGYRRTGRLLEQGSPPTAIVCTSDVLAVGVMSWCREHGIDIPGDISLAGLDDIPVSAHLPQPLTTVRYAVDQVGILAVQRMVELIAAGSVRPDPVRTMIPPELIVRSSTRPGPFLSGIPGEAAKTMTHAQVGKQQGPLA